MAEALRSIPKQEQASGDTYRHAMQLLRPMLAPAPDDPTFLTRMGLYAAFLGNEPDALN